MRCAKTNRRGFRFAFAAGALLLPPGAGLDFQAAGFDKPKAEQSAEAPSDSTRRQSEQTQRAYDRLLWAQRMFARGYISRGQLEAERETLREIGAQNKSPELRRTIERLLWTERMFAKGYVTAEQLEAEHAHLRKLQARTRPAKAPE